MAIYHESDCNCLYCTRERIARLDEMRENHRKTGANGMTGADGKLLLLCAAFGAAVYVT